MGQGSYGRRRQGRRRAAGAAAATNPRPRRELEHVMEVHAMEPRRRGRARRAERAADLFRRARDAHECVHLQCCAHALITCFVLRWDGPPKCARARARAVLIELKQRWAAVVRATPSVDLPPLVQSVVSRCRPGRSPARSPSRPVSCGCPWRRCSIPGCAAGPSAATQPPMLTLGKMG